jgi:hypothetical protein
MLKVRMDYPQAQQELDMVREVTRSSRADMLDVQPLRTVLLAEDVLRLQQIASELALDEQVLDYAVRLARATRTWPGLVIGAGPGHPSRWYAAPALGRCYAAASSSPRTTSRDAPSRYCVTVYASRQSWTSTGWTSTRYSSRCWIRFRHLGNDPPMKPTRLLLTWLGILLGLSILLGTAAALQFNVPDTLHSVAWGLLLALLLLAMLDAMRQRRRRLRACAGRCPAAWRWDDGVRFAWPWNMTTLSR